MKRSQAIKAIVTVLHDHGLVPKRPTKENGDIANDIIDQLRLLGMKPVSTKDLKIGSVVYPNQTVYEFEDEE